MQAIHRGITFAIAVLFSTGAQAQFVSYDRLMSELMQRYHLPGGAVAVTRNGKLLFAKGYGFADRERQEAVKPDSLFPPIASISSNPSASAADSPSSWTKASFTWTTRRFHF